jgi:hypothetical protein
MCVLLLPGCTYSASHTHHRRLRSQGGHDGPTVELCSRCHHEVHHNVAWANRHGLLLRTGDDPAVLVTTCGLECTTDHRVLVERVTDEFAATFSDPEGGWL